MNIHFGKLTTDNITITGSNITSASSGLNITGLTISDVASAKNALVTLDSAISTKSKGHLIVMLYDGAIKFMRLAIMKMSFHLLLLQIVQNYR